MTVGCNLLVAPGATLEGRGDQGSSDVALWQKVSGGAAVTIAPGREIDTPVDVVYGRPAPEEPLDPAEEPLEDSAVYVA